jgi:hypothetical protein
MMGIPFLKRPILPLFRPVGGGDLPLGILFVPYGNEDEIFGGRPIPGPL